MGDKEYVEEILYKGIKDEKEKKETKGYKGYHAAKLDLDELHDGESLDILFDIHKMHSRICSLDIDLHYSCFQSADGKYFLE